MSQPKRRLPEFASEETKVLIESYIKNIEILTSKHNNEVTQQRKNALFQEILSKVNAVGGVNRSLQNVKDKWQNICRKVRSKVAKERREQEKERLKTGGGTASRDTVSDPSHILSDLELEVYKILPVESHAGNSICCEFILFKFNSLILILFQES